MLSPLESLRNWLPIANTHGNSSEINALRTWLDSHGGTPAADIASALALRLPQLLSRQKNIHMQLRLVDSFTNFAERILPNIEEEVTWAPLPLPAEVRTKALAADNLLKALVSGYGAIVAAIEARRWSLGLRHLLQASLLRTMETIERRQGLAYRAYTCPSPASWLKLHHFYCIARQRDLTGSTKDPKSIEQVYARALLLALSDPTKRSRYDLASLSASIRQMLPLTRFGTQHELRDDKQWSPAMFPLPASNTRFLHPWADAADARAGDGLLLDTRRVVAELKRCLAEDIAALPCTRQLAESLAEMWNRPLPRRFSRSRLKPKADVISGIPAVAQYVQGSFARRKTDGVDSVPLRISEWYIINESPDGFGLRYGHGEADSLDVGDLIGVRPRERTRMHICIVRRVADSGHGRFEVGVQELSPMALPIPIANGDPSRNDEGILLPRMPAFANASGLAAPRGLLTAGGEIHWNRDGLEFRHRIERRIEGNHRTELFLLA
jgi:cyclic-di-GMP-binding protein